MSVVDAAATVCPDDAEGAAPTSRQRLRATLHCALLSGCRRRAACLERVATALEQPPRAGLLPLPP